MSEDESTVGNNEQPHEQVQVSQPDPFPYENPDITYVPSGRIGSSIKKMCLLYTIFSFVGAIVVSVVIDIVVGLAGIFLLIAGVINIAVTLDSTPFLYLVSRIMNICFFMGVFWILSFGVFFVGILLGSIVRKCTKLLHCRNRWIELLGIFIAVSLAVLFKYAILITHILFRDEVSLTFFSFFMGGGTKINYHYEGGFNVGDWDWSWAVVVFLGGIVFFFFLYNAIKSTAAMPEYCENCNKYMRNQMFKVLFVDTKKVLAGLYRTFSKNDRKRWLGECQIISGKDIPDKYLEIKLAICPTCNGGFVKLSRHKMEVDKEKKKKDVVTKFYSDRLDGKEMTMICDVLSTEKQVFN